MSEMNILFIGNSFTYFNDMYKTFEDICNCNGYQVNAEQIAYGGYSLRRHIEKPKNAKEIKDMIASKHWDYVVLQDQSRKPLDNIAEFISAIITLNDMIISNQGKTILYSTWSYKDNSKMLRRTKLSYNDFYQVLTDGYKEAAAITNALLAPVGTLFSKLHKKIDLLDEDDFHPNVIGSYVAALTFYKVIFGKDDELYVSKDITTKDAKLIRKCIKETSFL